MSYVELFGRDHDGRYLFSVFCQRCLATTCAAPEGGPEAVVEVTLEEGRRLHQTWVGDGYDEPRLGGDLVGWCQSARVVVAGSGIPHHRQLELWGVA